MRLQVDLGVDHCHQEGGEDEGDGEESDGGDGGERGLVLESLTTSPEV